MPGLDLEEDNNTTTRLLTLLNVSALKSSKRKRTESIEQTPRVKLNKRRSVQSDATEFTPTPPKEGEEKPEAPPPDATGDEDCYCTRGYRRRSRYVRLPPSRAQPKLIEFQKKNRTRTRTTSAHKVHTYLPHPKTQWSVTPGKPADRTGGHSVL
jgi:hypothetical protein